MRFVTRERETSGSSACPGYGFPIAFERNRAFIEEL